MIQSITDTVLGVILLRHDDPQNLSVQLEPPIVHPYYEKDTASREQLEGCFLLLDRLFAHGYRRIQMCVDVQDITKRTLCQRLGMTEEGRLCKHRIVKDANRDSAVYSLLNSDWRAGARGALYRKLYGDAAYQADVQNEKQEAEKEEQDVALAKRAKLESAATTKEKKKKK